MFQEALRSLKFYRGERVATAAILEELEYLKTLELHGNTSKQEVSDVEQSLDKPKENSDNDESCENVNPWMLLWSVPHNRRSLINSIVFMVLTVSSGMVAVQSYANQFFAKALPALSPDLCAVLGATVLSLTSLFTMAVTDLVTRRGLMISPCTIATAFLAVLGAVMRYPSIPMWVAILAILAILVFFCTFHFGVINIVFIQLSECFGPEVSGAATAIVFCFMYLANFIILFLFEPSVQHLGFDGTFFVFATITGVTTVLSVFFIKETRCQPLHKIQQMYADRYLYRNKIY